MLRPLAVAFVAIAVSSAAARADDLAALYPDAAVAVFGIEVKDVQKSPVGKKIIGTDNPFDATRKMIRVLLPDEALPVAPKAIKPLEAVANKLDRVTFVAADGGGLVI